MKKLLKREEGYFTVEVTLVFTVILFAIMLIIFVGVVLYQQVNLQSVVDKTASRGAIMYSSGTLNMDTEIKDFKECNPYRYFFNGSYKNQAQEKIEENLVQNIGFYNVYKSQNENTKVEIKDNIISRKITVSASKEYKFPIISAANTFGVKSPFNIEVSAESEVNDPAEFIRNTDLCTDAIKATPSGQKFITKASEIKDKIQEFISKLNIEN